MKSLPELQSHFFHSIIDNSNEFTPEVLEQGELSAQDRVAIYIDGYRLRLIEALQDSYPALHTLMGDDDFEHLCLTFIDQFPSTHFSIRYFGHQLASFLKVDGENDNAALLSEMATFEWCLRGSFDAKDESPLSLVDLADLSADLWPDLSFKLHPSLNVIDLHWNIPMLWKAIEQDAEPQPPQQNEEFVSWIIWRPVLETQFRSMTEVESMAFKLIQSGECFSQLCEALAEIDPEEPAQQAASFLATWIEEGLLVSFDYQHDR